MKSYKNFILEDKEENKEVLKKEENKTDVLTSILNGDIKVIDSDEKPDNSELKNKSLEEIKNENNEFKRKELLLRYKLFFGKDAANEISKELKIGIFYK